MRLGLILVIFLMLAGCMKVSEMANEASYHLSDVGLINHQRIERAASRRIQRDSLIYIVQSHFPPVEHRVVPDNVLAQETFNAFVQYFPHMRRSSSPLGLEQALMSARHEQADFLLYTRFAQANERPVLGQGVIQFMLYELGSGKLIDNGSIHICGGLLTSVNKKPEDLLRKPMQAYAQRLLGLREY